MVSSGRSAGGAAHVPAELSPWEIGLPMTAAVQVNPTDPLGEQLLAAAHRYGYLAIWPLRDGERITGWALKLCDRGPVFNANTLARALTDAITERESPTPIYAGIGGVSS